MVNRYNFYTIFQYNSETDNLIPLYNVRSNGVPFAPRTAIPHGTAFGGLDLYLLRGRDIAGVWDDRNHELNIVGFY